MATIQQFLETYAQAQQHNIPDHLEAIKYATQQLELDKEQIANERDEARIAAAVAHGALDRITDILTKDPATRRMPKRLRTAVASATEAVDPDAWENLLHQFQIMGRALTAIAQDPEAGQAQILAQNTLEELGQ